MIRIQQLVLEKTRAWINDIMQKNDAAHDIAHVDRVVKLALQLGEKAGADLFLVQMLALLHELEDDKLQSNVGSVSVEKMLLQMQLPKADIDFLLMGIPYISFRKYPKLDNSVPLEIRIVQDADRIDAMGAVGIARTFAYGGAKGRDLQESLAHFEEKLLKLYDLLSTPEGKKFAKDRRDFLEAFYQEFCKETQ